MESSLVFSHLVIAASGHKPLYKKSYNSNKKSSQLEPDESVFLLQQSVGAAFFKPMCKTSICSEKGEYVLFIKCHSLLTINQPTNRCNLVILNSACSFLSSEVLGVQKSRSTMLSHRP